MRRLEIFLHTFESGMADAWRKLFRGIPAVVIVEGDILEGPCDAVVSPAIATPKLTDICCMVLAMELALLVCASVVSA